MLNNLGIKNVSVVGYPSFFECGKDRLVSKKEWNHKVVTTGDYFNSYTPSFAHILQDELFFINLIYSNPSGDASDGSQEFEPITYHDLKYSFFMYYLACAGRLKFFSDYGDWINFYKESDPCRDPCIKRV